ncbi:MAG: hydantoinase/oxoprolinase family protein [Pseudomonadota bacterium]
MTNKLAVDIGGTFTDVVASWDGRLFSTKILTSHEAPANAVLEGIAEVLALAGGSLADADVILHGTTLATNALIERRGARTALLTTAGHRDVLAMAFENRFEQYDLNIERPAPLVPRELRLPIEERIAADGGVLVPLCDASVERAIEALNAAQVESVAVGLLHDYANPTHARRIGTRLAERLPHVSVTLACDVCPEIREYERFSTAVANAYVRPLMANYLADLEARVAGGGFTGALLLMTSGGGLTTAATAAAQPIRLVESGPAGGAILAASHARRLELDRVLAFDMGGTTAKLSLIDDGEPLLSRAFEVDRQYRFKKGSGLPLRIPVIEMVEIGAGGGSIARRDELERVQVGPQSAGSDPGPACYGGGGVEPTVTDADVLLGRLAGDAFAGGRMRLDADAARAALAKLEADARSAARAVSEIVDESMAAAARAHANEWGKDVAGRTLIAFGGAAPLHAARLAQKLGVSRIVVPAGAGVGSALGFLAAPIAFEVVRSRFTELKDYEPSLLQALTEDMLAEASRVVRPAVAADAELLVQRRAFMRYGGQGYEIGVELPAQGRVEVDELRARFEDAYRTLYGAAIPGLDVELMSVSLKLADRDVALLAAGTPHARAVGLANEQAQQPRDGSGHGYDGAEESVVILPRTAIDGEPRLGPAVVTEEQTTTYVPRGFTVRANAYADLILEATGGNE